MIYEIRIQNFKSIQNARLDFHLNPDGSPENKLDNEFKNLLVLVGQNGSGKSNFVDAIQFSVDAFVTDFEKSFAERGGFYSVYFSGAQLPSPVTFEIRLNISGRDYLWGYERAEPSTHTHTFAVTNEWCIVNQSNLIKGSLINVLGKNKDHHLIKKSPIAFTYCQSLGEVFKNGQLIHSVHAGYNDYYSMLVTAAFLDQMGKLPGLRKASPTPPGEFSTNLFITDFISYLTKISTSNLFPNTLKRPQQTSKAKLMHRHGENWAAILKGMNKEQEGRELIAALGQLVGDIDDYRVIEAGGYLIPEFHHRGEGEGIWRGAGQESDGTVRLAGLLTALLQKPTPKLICLEEPELGVHPGSLRLLMDFVRQALHDTQVIITTHSPELIDLVPPECLRVVTREGARAR